MKYDILNDTILTVNGISKLNLHNFCHISSVQSLSHVRLFVTPWNEAHQAPLLMDSPGKNIGMGCHSLLQGILLTQDSNLGCPRGRQILLLYEPPGRPIDIYTHNLIFYHIHTEFLGLPW